MRTAIILTLFMFLVAACSRCTDDAEPQVAVVQPTPTSTAIPTQNTSSIESLSTDARLVVEGGQGSVGEVIPVEVAIYDIVDGIAGYAIQVTTADPNIARINAVNLPDYGLTMVGDLPAPTVDITAVDLPDLLVGAFARETLATLDVELLAQGSTEIVIELRILDDDEGRIVTPQLVNGDILVN